MIIKEGKMKTLTYIITVLTIAAAVALTGCKQSMVINEVDYSQSIESVLTPGEDGMVEDIQHGIRFNIMPLQYEETGDTSSVTTEEVRFIRGHEGYYYITAPNYKHIYVMEPEEGVLTLKSQLAVTENGLAEPALNQRASYIQLINRETGESWEVRPEDIQKEESQMTKRGNN